MLDSTHNTTPILSDIFYGGSVSALACESLRRHLMEIATWMRAAIDGGRLFPRSLPSAFQKAM